MKILITGSSGFIGQHLSKRLKDHELYHLQSNLRDHKAIADEVLAVNPDQIIHLAARTEVEQSFYEQVTFSEINYVGTVNLIEAASKIKNLKNFVFASTMEVYGWQPISDEVSINGVPKKFISFDENTQPNPNAPYAVAKYACEKYLEYANRCLNLPFTALRQTNCYGRKDNNYFVTEQIITQMIKNKDEINLGYGTPYRNFIYIDDLLDAWEEVIRNPEKVVGEIFCLGPDNAIRIEDYVTIIANKLGWDGKVNWNTKPERPGEIWLLNSTNQKITSKLGWSPKVTMNEGLDRTIDHWKSKIGTKWKDGTTEVKSL